MQNVPTLLGDPLVLFDNLRAHFGEPPLPDGIDRDRFVAEFLHDLEGYSDRIYEFTARRMRSTEYPKPGFPALSLVQKTLQEVQRQYAISDLPLELKGKQEPIKRPAMQALDAWSIQSIEVADRLMDSDMGREAADEGWILGLWDYCRENRKLPNLITARALKEKRVDFSKMGGGTGHGMLLSAYYDMMEKDPETAPATHEILKTRKRQIERLNAIARNDDVKKRSA